MRNEIEKVLLTIHPKHKSGNCLRLDNATSQILSLLEEAVGEEWHHNSATWCAGANARRKDILSKINPEKGQSNE